MWIIFQKLEHPTSNKTTWEIDSARASAGSSSRLDGSNAGHWTGEGALIEPLEASHELEKDGLT